MLPAAARMRRRGDFTAAVREGRRVGRPSLVLHVRTSTEGGSPRVGLIVPRTVGSAVVRNRVRRRLRHLLRDRLDQLPTGSLVVVRVLPPAAAMTGERLATELDHLLSRAEPARDAGGRGERVPGWSVRP